MLTGIVAIFLSVCVTSIIGTSSDAAPRIGDDGSVSTAPTLDGNYAYINAGNVVEVIDGSEPFDKNDDAGNDSSETNGIVRSFDTASYDIEYSVDRKADSPYTYFENGRIGIRAVLPYDNDEAEFAVDDMGWLDKTSGYEAKVTTETIDGKQCQVFVGYRQLIASDSNPTTIPGQGTLKLIVNVKGLPNGAKVQPDVQLFAEHNESDEYYDVDVPELTVSAAPKYDVVVYQKQNRSTGRGTYKFADATSEYAPDQDAGDVVGAAAMYSLAFRVQNDTVSKGKKGLEFPSDKIKFTMRVTSDVKAQSSSTWQPTPDDYEPKIWTYYPNGNTGFASSTVGRSVSYAGQSWSSAEVYPGNSGGGKSNCKDGGVLKVTRNTDRTFTFEITDISYDIDTFPTNWNANQYAAANQFYISAFNLFVVQPFNSLEDGETIGDRMNTSDLDFRISITDFNLQAETASGVKLPDAPNDSSNQSMTTNDTTSVTINYKMPGSFSALGCWTRATWVHCGVDLTDWTGTWANGYDTLPIGYENTATPLRIGFGFSHAQYDEGQIPVYAETMVKFDATAVSVGDISKTVLAQSYCTPSKKSQWGYSIQFGVKPDGTHWENDEEAENAGWDDVIWYDSQEEAEDHGIIVAMNALLATPYDTNQWGSASTELCVPMTVTDDMSKVNYVAELTIRSRYWTRNTLKDEVASYVDKNTDELTFDDYLDYSKNAIVPYTRDDTNLPNPTSTYAHDANFIKTAYGEDGPISGQSGNTLNGDSLLLTGEQASITRSVSQQVNGLPKTIYDMDYGERYADIVLIGTTKMLSSTTSTVGMTTNVMITDKLPKGLTYIPNTSFYGGTYVENTPDAGSVSGGTVLNPQVTSNPDGTTTLVWQITGVTVGEELPPIRYSVSIGDQSNPDNDVINNQTLTGTASISSTYDKRTKNDDNGNISSYTIRISKLRQSNLAIAVSPRFNELDSPFAYTSSIGNYGTNPISDAYGICVLPNADNSSYDGTYSVSGIRLDSSRITNASDIEIYATSDASIIGSDPNDLSLSDIKSSWTKLMIASDGRITVPSSLTHMTAWCIVKGNLPSDERMQVVTDISPSGNSSRDSYTATMSDGANTVRDTAYIVERTVSGRVWVDKDANGQQDDGEQPFTGITVSVVDANGDVVRLVSGGLAKTDVSDDGTYEIAGLPSGTFRIEFRESETGSLVGYESTEANKDGVSDTLDSDAVGIVGDDGWTDGGDVNGLEFPAISDMSSNVFAMEHVDYGVVPSNPSIDIVKIVDKSTLENDDAVAGTVLTYTLTVTNDGDTELTDVRIDDELVDDAVTFDWGGSSDPATGEGVLSAGETVTAKATYTVTQDDVDAGIVPNAASVFGTSPRGDEVTDTDDVETVIRHKPEIRIEKDVDKKSLTGDAAVVGTTLTYSFTITNTGNVTLHDVALDDKLDGVYDLSIDWDGSSDAATGDGVLSPGEAVSATAKYDLTQGDIDASHVVNTAEAVGTSPQDEEVSSSDTVETVIGQSPRISLDKSTPQTNIGNASAGRTVPFTFKITNTGNVTLHDVTLTDNLDGIYDVVIDWATSTDDATGDGVLSVGESVSGTAKYDLTQSDIDNGSVTNTATTEGTSPLDEKVSDDDDVIVHLDAPSDVKLTKTVDVESLTGDDAVAGKILTYTFDIENTGETTLRDVRLVDHLHGMQGQGIDWSTHTDDATDDGVLSPDEHVFGTMTYELTQADIDAGAINNTASVYAVSPYGTIYTSDDMAGTTTETNPSLSLVKTASTSKVSGNDAVAGYEVEWFFELTNTGNVTLTDIDVEDYLDGTSDVDYGGWSRTLVPGASHIVSATYKLTQADIDAGKVTNTAIAHSKAPDGSDVDSNESTVDVIIEQGGGLTIEKHVDKEMLRGNEAVAGATLTYTFDVVNAGNVTLHDVNIEDYLDGVSDIVTDWDGSSDTSTEEGVLSPNEKVVATATYVVTQADVDSGGVLNTAIAHGIDVNDGPVDSNESSVLTEIEQHTGLLLDKQVDKDHIEPASVGDVLTYTFVVTNKSNVTLTDLTITDELNGISGIVFDWGSSTDEATDGNVLSPDESVTGTATYKITQEDIDAGKVINTAMAHMMSAVSGNVDSNEDTVETTLAVHAVDNGELTISDMASDVIEEAIDDAKEVLTQTGAKTYVGIGALALICFIAYKIARKYRKQ